jgi:hypothetical protein
MAPIKENLRFQKGYQSLTSFSKSTTSVELWNSRDLCRSAGAVESIGAAMESVGTAP